MNSPALAPPNSSPRKTWIIAFASAIALWVSFPPLNIWLMAWVATAGWCWLIAQPNIAARRPYRLLYIVGFVHWMLVLQAVRLPHWSAGFGWIALSAYLAVYIPAFVGLARVMVHHLRIPLCLACPIAWTGLELIRSYFLTGIAIALVAHTQIKWPAIMQVASLGGAYLVSFLIVFCSACLVQSCFPNGNWKGNSNPDSDAASPSVPLAARWPILLLTLIGVATLFYGRQQLRDVPSGAEPLTGPSRQEETADGITVALIQGCIDTTFDESADPRMTLKDYRRLTTAAMEAHPEIDFIVWPESMQQVIVETRDGLAGIPWYEVDAPAQLPAEFVGDAREFENYLNICTDVSRHEARWFARNFRTPVLIGAASIDAGPHPLRRFNSALWLNENGDKLGRYNKMHPVMFGEYVPFGKQLPFLYSLTPMGSGLEPGAEPLAVRVESKNADKERVTFSPCICFENTVPHLVRRQVKQLTANGDTPDALVTLTNDGWFWGSSILDFHLACGIYRAVEMRRPMLIAANTGFSAVIDDCGRVLDQGPRRAEGTLLARIKPRTTATSLYERAGDWVCGFPCAVLCLVAAIRGWLDRRAS